MIGIGTEFIPLVQEFFPEVTADQALDILWNYTGFPFFLEYDPTTACREQLAYLKEVGPEAVDAEFDVRVEVTA